MMQAQLTALHERGSTGVFLQMHESNMRARRFYAKLGFTDLHTSKAGEPGSGGDLYLGFLFGRGVA